MSQSWNMKSEHTVPQSKYAPCLCCTLQGFHTLHSLCIMMRIHPIPIAWLSTHGHSRATHLNGTSELLVFRPFLFSGNMAGLGMMASKPVERRCAPCPIADHSLLLPVNEIQNIGLNHIQLCHLPKSHVRPFRIESVPQAVEQS